MKIALTVGHSRLKSGIYSSADGTKFGGGNEYIFNKQLTKYIAKNLKKNGHKVDVIICPEKKFTESSQERKYKLNIVNKGSYDLIIELHLNAGPVKSEGCEVLYKSQNGKIYADAVQKKLGTVFKSRGIKQREDLYMLNQSIPTCIMLETFFCTNVSEWQYAKKNKQKIARLIADGIGK